MSEQAERSRWWIYCAAALAMLLVLYVTSIGPAEQLVYRAGLDPAPFKTFYAPLNWLDDSTPLGRALGWYMDLWYSEAAPPPASVSPPPPPSP
jgi:hypothetical protein